MDERRDPRPGEGGFVDMSRFDATDPADALDPATQARLRDILMEAPVPVPGHRRFDELLARALEDAPGTSEVDDLVPDDAEGAGQDDAPPAEADPSAEPGPYPAPDEADTWDAPEDHQEPDPGVDDAPDAL